jgi:hypothetical protein
VPENSGGSGRLGGKSHDSRLILNVPRESTPALTTNQVLSIASNTALSRKYDMSLYQCEMLVFQPQVAQADGTNRWMAHFVTRQHAPDLDFFVLVDDDSGRATLKHR